jgi:dipeptidyl aminopeptidase/acylaminoacyl peptidase
VLGGLVLAIVIASVLLFQGVRTSTEPTAAGQGPAHPTTPPFVMFRVLSSDETHGRLAVLPLAPYAEPQISDMTCVRLHYAAGRGICVTQETHDRAVRHVAHVFDGQLVRGARIELDGVATRVRVAPDGRTGAITTYGEEEGPTGERLATWTRLIDMTSGRQLADLRDFRIDNERLPAMSAPLDVSSVAFEDDGDRFFATVATASDRYLVSGSLRERRLSTLRTGVASEALSPDGHRLAVKRLIPERGVWQVAVIDLATWDETDLPHGHRSVDDQVEWFDNRHVMYHDVDGETTSVWVLSIDGTSAPRVQFSKAYSAVIQR